MRLGVFALVLILVVASIGAAMAAPLAPLDAFVHPRSSSPSPTVVERSLDPLSDHRRREQVLPFVSVATRGVAGAIGANRVRDRGDPPDRAEGERRTLRPPRASSSSRPSPSSH